MSTGATNRHSNKLFAFMFEAFTHVHEHFIEIVKKFLGCGGAEHVVGDGFVDSAEWSQFWYPEWVGEESDVDHDIGVAGGAVFEAE